MARLVDPVQGDVRTLTAVICRLGASVALGAAPPAGVKANQVFTGDR